MAKKKDKTIDFSEVAAAGLFANTPKDDTDKPIGILNEESAKLDVGERINLVPVRSILHSQSNQKVYDVDELDALAKDISERGIQQPILLRQSPNGMYIIISGHRRFAANALAREKYGYKDGDYLPCIVRDNIKDSIEEREAIILDNLQRDKSEYTKMMELIEMRRCGDERVARGEDIPSVRDWVLARMGVSQSELTRYEKIYYNLIPELKEQFHAHRLSTHVAYTIASSVDVRGQTYIFENWDWKRVDGDNKPVTLTYPEMKKLLVEFENSLGKKQKPVPKASSKPVKLKNVSDGVVALRGSFNSLAERVESLSDVKLLKKDEKALLKVAGKLLQELANFEELMNTLYKSAENGKKEGDG